MDSMSAFARGEANRGKPQMVFDWDKAVKIILANGYKNCGAGLDSDYEYTAGTILFEGNTYDEDCTYLASTWAKPQLIIYSDPHSGLYEYEEVIDCYIMDNETTYHSGTKFPEHLKELFK